MLIIDKILLCDKCHESFGDLYHLHAYVQREMAKKYGWVHIHGKDYCPECKPNKPFKNDALKRAS